MLYPRRLAYALEDIREPERPGGGCAGIEGNRSSEGGSVSFDSLSVERH